MDCLIMQKKILQEPFDLISVPGIFEIPIIIAKNIKNMMGSLL